MFMTRVLSINNLQTRVVLAAHKADVLSPSIALLSSPAPSHQRPSLPRCILVCIISSSSSSPSFILNLKSHSLALAWHPISPHHREHPSQRIHHYRERLCAAHLRLSLSYSTASQPTDMAWRKRVPVYLLHKSVVSIHYADTSNSGAIRSATPSSFFFQVSNLSASLPICVRDSTRGCTHVITAF